MTVKLPIAGDVVHVSLTAEVRATVEWLVGKAVDLDLGSGVRLTLPIAMVAECVEILPKPPQPGDTGWFCGRHPAEIVAVAGDHAWVRYGDHTKCSTVVSVTCLDRRA